MKNNFQKSIENQANLISENTADKNHEISKENGELKSNRLNNIDKRDNIVKRDRICRFYLKGKCKHGLKGKNCEFHHPKACPKLMKHGNKTPRGCNAGSKCDDYHPRMCASSIKLAECYNDSCSYAHVKGTKRKSLSKLDNNKNRKNTESKDFLKVLDNFKLEMMNIVETKLKQYYQLPMFTQPNNQMFPPPAPTNMQVTNARDQQFGRTILQTHHPRWLHQH